MILHQFNLQVSNFPSSYFPFNLIHLVTSFPVLDEKQNYVNFKKAPLSPLENEVA